MSQSRRGAILLPALLIPFLAPALAAQGTPIPPASATAPAQDAHAAARTATAAQLQGPITLDGRLDDAAWASVEPVTGFLQLDPLEGQPSSQRTVVRIAFDDEAVYVGAMLFDTGPITLRVARRDADLSDSDAFGVTFDSYHDHQTAFRFAVNASGVQLDDVLNATGDDDASWNPVWDAAVAVGDSGWSAELRIPFSQLRFRSGERQRWGLQLERVIARDREHAVFAFTPKDERGGPARFAHLDGIRGHAGAHRLELLPYVVARADYRAVPVNPDVTFANPYRDESDYGLGVGGDLKFRLSSNFTLDGTVNPDFGQVEADPAQINLTAFETRFEERRPFFVEGAEIFRFGSDRNRNVHMVYSRRVGRAPQGDAPSTAVYTDAPEAATILGAAKITGKTANGWSMGVINAVTGRETVPFVEADQSQRRAAVEPLTNYFAARARRSTADGATSGGALLTAVNRRLEDEPLPSLLRASGVVGGADFRRDWHDRTYSFAAEVTSSVVRGSPEAMLRTQRSSARYYQRPDATHLSLDSAATSMAGYHTFFLLGKLAGDWQGDVTGWATSPGYEINDFGFQTTADRRGVGAELSYRENTPGPVFRRWEVELEPEATWNFAGDRIGGGVGFAADATLLNYWGGEVFAEWLPASLDDRLTRGGPLARRPSGHGFGAELSSNENLPLSVWMRAAHERDVIGGRGTEAEFNVQWKPASNVRLSMGPEFETGRAAAQYVTSVGDPAAAATFGRRYVFAPLEQTTLSLGLRANVAFTPKLTVESYLEPFVSSGNYGTYAQLRAPRTHDFAVYGEDLGTIARDTAGMYHVDPDAGGPSAAFVVPDRDYTYRSLRGSAVLRWEWRRGSTLYLVWQQQRELERVATGEFAGDDRIGRFDPANEARGLLAIPPQNVLQVKVTYWLNP